jgi:hypothetical protein
VAEERLVAEERAERLAAEEAAVTTKNARATVIFYRTSKLVGSGSSAHVLYDGKKIADLTNKSYITVHAPIGRQEFVVDFNGDTDPITVNLEEDQIYYIHFTFSSLARSRSTNIAQVTKTMGSTAIRSKNLRNKGDIDIQNQP